MEYYTHTHTMEYYLALKGNEMFIYTTTEMNLKNIVLCHTSQTQKDRYCVIPLI